MTTKNTFKEHVLRVVAVVGLIAVLLLGAWGIIQLAFFIPGFLSNIAGGIINRTPTTQTETPSTPTTDTNTPATPPIKTTTKPTTVVASKPTSTAKTSYVPSNNRTNLYGYPDLQVRILSNPSMVRAGIQMSLQFVVENVGTNVSPQNWTFTASLPYNPVYTYQSQGQQALYPGDKIVYTLGYTAQYTAGTDINPCSGWTYPCTNPTAVYGGPGTCNLYGPCNIPGYAQNIYGYTYPAQNYGGIQTASVTVDPLNYVWEQNESNNYAAVSYTVY